MSVYISGYSQGSFWKATDSLHKGRLIGTSVSVGSVWAGSMIGLGKVWYSDVEKSKWHAFDDSRNWLQMDKAGHFYTAYKLNQLNTDLFKWTGMKDRTALWIGTGISLGYQTTLEMFDAFSQDWGFSWADFTANAVGTGFYLGQELIWNEERIIPKFSYHSTEYASIRPEILGNTFAESLLKDYNGQTYWLSFSPGTFIKSESFPDWLCFSFGYSADQKLVGSEEYYMDPSTGIEYHSQREFLFSLDVDFSRLPVKRPWLKVVLKQLNYLKVPFPALIYNGSSLKASGLYF